MRHLGRVRFEAKREETKEVSCDSRSEGALGILERRKDASA